VWFVVEFFTTARVPGTLFTVKPLGFTTCLPGTQKPLLREGFLYAGRALYRLCLIPILYNMSTNYLFHDAAFKHGVSETDIRRAFARPLFDGLLEDYDDKFLLTGFDVHGTMLEVMYNFIDPETVYIFHAMKCRKAFRMLRNQD
jgi:hypothetical protein